MTVNTVGPIVVTDIFLHLLKKSSDPRLILVTSSLGSLPESSDCPSFYYKLKADYPSNSCRASKVALNMIFEFPKREGDKIKMWGGDTDWLATDFANAEMIRKLGAPHPSVRAKQVASRVEGERDADVGKDVDKYGIGKW